MLVYHSQLGITDKEPKMKLTKRKNRHCLLVKLDVRDRKYLQRFKKHEHPKYVQSINKAIDFKGNEGVKKYLMKAVNIQ